MLNKEIKFLNFNYFSQSKKKKIIVRNILNTLLKENNQILESMKKNYQDSYNQKIISNCYKINEINVIGMGGSALGAKAIYSFLKPLKKKFNFFDNISNKKIINSKKKSINLIISKSGDTLETISNSNLLLDKKKNIFISESKKSYLTLLANKIRAEVVSHNNFIGGRYSVLSEVGMLPAQLMGFDPSKFRKFNDLVKSNKFINALVNNVLSILYFHKQKKTNSIILNYDDYSDDLFRWYQQLVAESLGKKNKGILPIISKMPCDNHSLMQYYLEGNTNHFFTFFFVKEKKQINKINNKIILDEKHYLKNKSLNEIAFSQFIATQNVFKSKKIPFRSFVISKRTENTLGELFSFFMLETIMLGKLLNINPYDQPAVELIKKSTLKILK